MNKAFFITIVLVFSLLLSSVSATASRPIRVMLNGRALSMDRHPVIRSGRTLVPLRAIFEALGAEVNWDDSTRTITGKNNEITIILQIDNPRARVNNRNINLDVPPAVIGGRTMVPTRFIAESLGARVDWNNRTRTVTVDTRKYAWNPADYNHLPEYARPHPNWSGKEGEVGEPGRFLYEAFGMRRYSRRRTVPTNISRQIYERPGSIVHLRDFRANDEFAHPGTTPSQELIDRFGDYAREWPEFAAELPADAKFEVRCGSGRMYRVDGFSKYDPVESPNTLQRRFIENNGGHEWLVEFTKGTRGMKFIRLRHSTDRAGFIGRVNWTQERRNEFIRQISYSTTRDEARVIVKNLDEIIESANLIVADLGVQQFPQEFDIFRTDSGLFVIYRINSTGFSVTISSNEYSEDRETLDIREDVRHFREYLFLD